MNEEQGNINPKNGLGWTFWGHFISPVKKAYCRALSCSFLIWLNSVFRAVNPLSSICFAERLFVRFHYNHRLA